MAYHFERNGDIVIDGFDKGIGADPYSGLSDLKGVNPDSISGEVSVSFSSASVMKAPIIINGSGTLTSGTPGTLLSPTSLKVEQGQWVTFSSLPANTGLSTNTPYWLFSAGTSGANTTFQLFAQTATYPPSGSALGIGAAGSCTFSTIVPSLSQVFQKSRAFNFMLDDSGRVWSDKFLTAGADGGVTATSSWEYIGNATDTSSHGNGLLLYQTVHDSTGGTGTPATADEWLFVWRNGQIDYTQVTTANSATNPTWVNGWVPSTGTTGSAQYLQTAFNVGAGLGPHMAIVTPDGRVNYCDANYIGNFYQNVPAVGSSYTGFNPKTLATYTFANITAIVPPSDVAQCLAFSNQYLLVGGRQNIIYPWDLNPAHNTYSTPLILLPENNIVNMVTIGNNTFIFCGNRGNIYITNGSQASFYKKIPDHVSGSVEPLFNWGGAIYSKKRLYFGINANLQSGGTVIGYGGLWCIDINSDRLWNSQQMSYGSYSGYISALGVSVANTAGGSSYGSNIGYGIICGWTDNGIPTYGIDVDVATPFTGTQASVTSDMVPIGTLYQPQTSTQLEFKLSTPLLAGESVTLNQGSYFDPTYASFTPLGTVVGDGALLSGNFPIKQQNQQWGLVQAVLSSKATTPSYVRLKELRIIKPK